jgi:predicted acyltransferase
MAVFYNGLNKQGIVWMRAQWWGILGLIGWSYLLCAVIFYYSKGRISVLTGALIFFSLFNISVNAGWLDFLDPMKSYIWIVGNGSMPALTMAGIFVSCVYQKSRDNKSQKYWLMLSAIGIFMLAGGFALRPFLGGISKIRATPSWVMICTGISILCFMFFNYLIDIKKKQNWFAIIRPAGTSTLTVYLLPYIHYALYNIFCPASALPLILRTGSIGIIKSLLYSLLIIMITSLLEKKRIRLKI